MHRAAPLHARSARDHSLLLSAACLLPKRDKKTDKKKTASRTSQRITKKAAKKKPKKSSGTKPAKDTKRIPEDAASTKKKTTSTADIADLLGKARLATGTTWSGLAHLLERRGVPMSKSSLELFASPSMSGQMEPLRRRQLTAALEELIKAPDADDTPPQPDTITADQYGDGDLDNPIATYAAATVVLILVAILIVALGFGGD